MKKEDLFESFGALEDDLLEKSEQQGKAIKKGNNGKKDVRKILRVGSIAACLAAAIGAGVYFMDVIKTPGSLDKQNKLQDEYVDVATLLTSSYIVELQALALCHVNIQDHDAIYQKVRSVESDRLGNSIGSEVAGTKNWYKLSGHEDMQYLVFFDGNEYSLWEFDSFRNEPTRGGQDENQTRDPQESYPYRDVMEIIYNIHSAEDIAEIIVAPPTIDNSAKGKELQAEIGTSTITDSENIDVLYDILSDLTCYGGNHWEMIGLGQDTPSAMLDYTRAGRYLTIVTSQGMEIDTLKYTGINGMFYEYGGIAYNVLTGEEKNAVEEILNIKPGKGADDPGNSQADNPSSDIPADENTYHEAREYSAELTDLQNRISEAMINKELPFVIASAIYENPDRLHVVVTTKDEELLARLKAFDTTGRLLEIEYSEYNNTVRNLVEKR